MSQKRQPFKKITNISTRLIKRFLATIKKQLIWLLRTVFSSQKQQQSTNAGFVLPTVAMVSVVVVLLTTAIMFRSFDRAKIASNVRVNQIAMNSATPAIDRARAKLKKLFEDNRLARATPTEAALDGVLVSYQDEYTFGDEKNLTINCIDPSISSGLNAGVCANTAGKELKTAWQFPVDTDNNGKFDSYTLYGIYYKNPDLNSTNTQYKVKRNPIQARTTPMTFTSIGGSCGTSKVTSASLVGVNGWFKGNKSLRLVKAFFVYTVTVPITSTTTIPSATSSNYEVNTGNRSFSALEYEQDKVQQSLINNAVVYQDDLTLTPGVDFRLNGRIFTNANFLTGSNSANIRIYQVSSPNSCFYEAENAKITVGGNISNGGFTGGSSAYTTFDLFPGKGNTPSSSSTPSTIISLNNNESVTDASTDVAYNNLAFTQRVNLLVAAQIAAYPNNTDGTGAIQTNDPSDVQEGIQQQKDAIGLSSYTDAQVAQYRSEQLQAYFQKRTRRVPFKEVAFGANAVGSYNTTSLKPIQGSANSLRPVDAWSYPTNPSDGITGTGYTTLTLNKPSTTSIVPSATEPTLLLKNAKEKYLGDRIQIGNNLPQLWWKSSESKFVGPDPSDTQSISGINWTEPTSPAENRYRLSQIQTLADVGSTDRDRDWELAAAKVPQNPQDPVGGLRVITGAGIYLRSGDTAATTSFTGASTTVWSDMMPMPNSAISAKITQRPYLMYDNGLAFTIPTPSADTPSLRMRATAVYHYKQTGYSQTAPTPIACVSSFYDPTNSTTANNLSSLPTATNWTPPTGFGGGRIVSVTGGLSNNGIVYGPPTKGVSDYQDLLTYQSTLTYANGRSIDDGLLARALGKTAANRTLSELSTIDAAICALQILDVSVTPSSTVIDHGSIFEAAFLDGRQIRAIHSDNTSTTADERFVNVNLNSTANPSTVYDLPRQDRQPVEIRATVLDLGKLRAKTIGGTTPSQEYLIPNSGIIYATRDDALVDKTSTSTDETANKLESSVDYKLDPSRRPNAIVLANGSNISREPNNNYLDAEKGLIVATNLPSYIKGNFNLHSSGEEFTTALDDTWSNFYTRAASTLNSNFACRKNDPRLSVGGVDQCATGDTWRSAAVISDAMTLLSNDYRLGFRNEGDYDWNNNSSNPTSISATLPIPNTSMPTRAFYTGSSVYTTTTTTTTANTPTATSGATTTTTANTAANVSTTTTTTTNTAPAASRTTTTTVSTTTASSPNTNFRFNTYAPRNPRTMNGTPINGTPISGTSANGLESQFITTTTSDCGTYGDNCSGYYGWRVDDLDSTVAGSQRSSYLFNFVTPVVRQIRIRDAKDYVYEVCDTSIYTNCNSSTTTDPKQWTITAVADATYSATATNAWRNNGNAIEGTAVSNFRTGSFSTDPAGRWANFPRRVAFKRDNSTGALVSPLTVYGVNSSGNIAAYAVSSTSSIRAVGGSNNNLIPALELDSNGQWRPILWNSIVSNSNENNSTDWFQPATSTIYNVIIASGDTPARTTEDNGGLHNYVRFAESWTGVNAKISGSFMQLRKSSYATAPFATSLTNPNDDALKYSTNNGGNRLPFYQPPVRLWGYDVGILSQSPDLFSQKLVIPVGDLPNEYFREVGRDDPWVQNLLCAKNDANTSYVIDQNQRPSICQS